MRSRIIGTGSYLPARVVDNVEIGGFLAMPSDTVYRLTGIQTRHWAGPTEATSDLAVQAARRACRAAGISPASIEAVIVSTTSPDRMLPSTACTVQAKLGLGSAAAFDLAASCSGFLYALSMADRIIRSGQFRRCLVVAAEIKSRFLDVQDPSTAVLFSDGAGAAIVQAEVQGGTGIQGIRLYADGAGHHLIGIPGGGSRSPTTVTTLAHGEHVLRMHGAPLFRMAVKQLAGAVKDLLKEFGYDIGAVDVAVFHQANGRLLSALCKRLSLPLDTLYSIIDRIGNPSSASLPIALDYAVREGRLTAGDLVLLGTFGGGATWATALMRW